nr:tetratricopeptide repeat protein [bacterium]
MPSSPSPTESKAVGDSLRALRRGLLRAHGFALFIAVIDSPTARDRLIAELTDSLPDTGPHVVAVPPDTTDPLDEIIRQLPDGPTAPIMLIGLEGAVSFAREDHPVYQALNIRRPEWADRLDQPVVLWVPAYILGAMGRQAPDFLDWRSDTIHFPDMTEAGIQAFDRLSTSGGIDDGLPLQHRRERMRELESLIKMNRDSTDKTVQGARAKWLTELGNHHQALAEYAQAEQVERQAVALAEDAFGPEHPNVATCVGNLGIVLQGLGDLRGAKECYERALRIKECALGEDHPGSAICANNLGGVLYALGDLAQARECYERALRIDEASSGPNHPSVARDINNLGTVLQDLGDLAEAKKCYERALAVDEVAFGPDHPGVARDVNNLGGVLRELGDLTEAKECFERALRISEVALGAAHPQVAICVNNLGGILQDLGDLAAAKEYYERASRIDEAA